MMMFNSKPDSELTDQERTEREARRKAIREQITNDQTTGAKRDSTALRKESTWKRNQGK